MPNGVPSANVYFSNTESALRDNDKLVDNAIQTVSNSSDHDTSPIQRNLPSFFDFNHPNG